MGKFRLCQAQDSQKHMLHYCTEIAAVRMREEVIITLKQQIYKYANDKKAQRVGDAFLWVLQETPEPGRMWIGNISSDQISQLQETVASFTQAQLINIKSCTGLT